MKTFILNCVLLGLFFYSFPCFSQVDVLTQHHNQSRTGWNNQETSLNHTTVSPTTFGLLFSKPVDDQIFAQPLVVNNVSISGAGTPNVVYLCTVNNSIYAYDADNGTLYWQKNFTPSGFRPPQAADMHPSLCNGIYWDFPNQMGIVGTPVIAKAANTMYFVSKAVDTTNVTIDNTPFDHSVPGFEYTYSSAGFHQYIHAIDLSTGNEKPGSPVEITASAPGNGDGNVNGTIFFDPRRQFNRAGLVLSRGIVYIPIAAHCDFNPCHGWMLGYDSATLQQKIVYITTPNDGRGGIWMSGGAPAVDSAGNLYVTTGNAYDGISTVTGTTFNSSPADTANRGESVIKLTPNAPDRTATSLYASSFFTPYNYAYLNDGDLDYPIQTMLIPNTNMLMTGCKDYNLYLMNTSNLGGFSTTGNNILQTVSVGSQGNMHSSFAYFGGSNAQYVYQLSENTILKAYPVGTNSLGTAIVGNTSGPTGNAGGFMAVSSNGSDTSTGILWVNQAINGCDGAGYGCQGILRAVNASNITNELWNSTLYASDNPGHFGKMSCPTVANGKVYVNSASNQFSVYGILTTPRCAPNVALGKSVNASSYSNSLYAPSFAVDGNMTTSWNSEGTNTEWFVINLGQVYDICGVSISWVSYGINFNIQVSLDSTTWTTIDAVTNNSSYYTQVSGSYQAKYVRMYGTLSSYQGYKIYEMQVLGTPLVACTQPISLSVTNISQNTATLKWGAVTGANQYFVEYKTPIVSSWDTLYTTNDSVNLSGLSCTASYNFQVQSVCSSSSSSAFSLGAFNTNACTAPCGLLPTRHYSADVGRVGVAGTSCLSNGIYTIQGSGNGIGGNSDQFQFAFIDLIGDNTLSTQVLTQDNVNPNNMAGLMMRDSVSNTAMFAYVAVTSGNGIIFEYRNSPAGPVTVVNGPNLTAPIWLELVRTGTQYVAYYSTTGDPGSWIQVGSTNISFTGISAYMGMAVTSSDNSVLSTATFENYLDNGIPLPVDLISFTAKNVNNEYAALNWVTASETSSAYFDVERSTDRVVFSKLGSVNASGNSNSNINYSFQDNNPAKGINYYRLKEVDVNGNYTYSSIDQLNFVKGIAPTISPNPADTYFEVNVGSDAILDITIYDAAGKLVMHRLNENGSTNITVPIKTLAAGVYIVEMRSASQVYQQKLLKQ